MQTWRGQIHHHDDNINDHQTCRSYGDILECRKVLQLAINSVTEHVELLYDFLIQLEQDKGVSVCLFVCARARVCV